MSHMIKLECADYNEFWLDLDLMASVGISTVVAVDPQGHQATIKACIVTTSSGQKILFPGNMYQMILKAKLDSEQVKEDINVDPVWLQAWDDEKGDDVDKP